MTSIASTAVHVWFTGVLLAGGWLTVLVPATRGEVPESTAEWAGEEHPHAPSMAGGLVVPIGNHFHIEAVFENGGTLRLYMLGRDETVVMPVEIQQLRAYVRAGDDHENEPFTLAAEPQPGDPTGTTSVFGGRLPERLVGRAVVVSVPALAIGKERYRVSFASQPDAPAEPAMPAGVSGGQEKQIYLTPAGKYTASDILANGPLLPAAKFRRVRSAHDFNPQPGDRICPITRTKANPAFTWVIGGQTYSFCCPPCIDEFVARAKQQPETIQDAAAYVQPEK